VKAGCSVLLYYEAMAFFGRNFTGWFGSAVELAFAFVFFESHRKKVAKFVAAVASTRNRRPPLLDCHLCYIAR